LTDVVWEGDPTDLGFTDADLPVFDEGFHGHGEGSHFAVSATLKLMRGKDRMVRAAVGVMARYFERHGLTSLAELKWTWKAVSDNEVLFEPPKGHAFTDAYVVVFVAEVSATWWFAMNFGLPPKSVQVLRVPIEMRQ
jgi:hypothetical protein